MKVPIEIEECGATMIELFQEILESETDLSDREIEEATIQFDKDLFKFLKGALKPFKV